MYISKINNMFLLSLITASLMGCASEGAVTTTAPTTPDTPATETKDVAVYTTTANRSKQMDASFESFASGSNMSPSTITLSDDTKYQAMDGFGAAITGSTCYNLLKMTQANRTKFLKQTFSETDGLGYSYIRMSIGCSDFSLSEYTCCDKQGISNFALTAEETDYIIPVLKEILAINPNIRIMATPWTAPKWMKVNNLTDKAAYDSWTGGQLNPDYYQDYATYFVKWIQAMNKEGIKIYAVTPQNEPLNRGNSASMYMGWEEELAFVRDALGPQFKSNGIDTQIYAFDHNYNYDDISGQQHYPLNLYADNAASDFLTGAAYHNYGGDVSELSYIEQHAPAKGLIFTETSIGTWNDGRNFSKRLMEDMQQVGLNTIANYCKAVIVWNLMLDMDMGPNRKGGCQTCYGAVDISRSDYSTISANSHYYVIGHLSKVVKQGAIRIATTGYTASGLSYQAFINPNGSHALVALNNSSELKSVTVADSKHHFSTQIPAYAVVSYKW